MLANAEEIPVYRQKIMEALINNKSVCELVLNRTITEIDSDIQDELTNGHIYKFPYVPDVQETAKTYINFDIDGENSNATNLYKDMSLYFWIFSHKSIIKHSTGDLRTDLLNIQVQRLFNDNADFGIGKMFLLRDRMFTYGDDYAGRRLIFQVKDLNKANCR